MNGTDDPMAYEAMREISNQLVGTYLYRLNHTANIQQKNFLKNKILDTSSQVRNVNPDDQEAILTAASELANLTKEQHKLIQEQKITHEM